MEFTSWISQARFPAGISASLQFANKHSDGHKLWFPCSLHNYFLRVTTSLNPVLNYHFEWV